MRTNDLLDGKRVSMYRGIDIKNGYIVLFRKYDWRWFCTLTFRPGIRRWAIAQLFVNLISAIELKEGKKTSWVRVIEHGSLGGRLHIHALIAGTAHVSRHEAELMWSDIAGGAEIGQYDPDSRGLSYILKTIEDDPNNCDNLDQELLDEHLLDPAELRRRIENEF